MILAGCGQGSGQAGNFSGGRSRVSAQIDAVILIRHWLRAFYPTAFSPVEIQEQTGWVFDEQGRGHLRQVLKNGLIQDIITYPDQSAEITSIFPDKSWQKWRQSRPMFENNIFFSHYTVDFSDEAHLEYSLRRDDKGDFDFTNNEITFDGRFDFPDGSRIPFRLERDMRFAWGTNLPTDRLTVTLENGLRFAMTVKVDPDELYDPTVPVGGSLEEGGKARLTYTLQPDPQTPGGWLWEGHDPASGLVGRFRLNEQFAGFGQWQMGEKVESTVSWQMPLLPSGGGGLPGQLEAKVTLADAQSYIAGPSAATLAFLNRYWDALGAFYYPQASLRKPVRIPFPGDGFAYVKVSR